MATVFYKQIDHYLITDRVGATYNVPAQNFGHVRSSIRACEAALRFCFMNQIEVVRIDIYLNDEDEDGFCTVLSFENDEFWKTKQSI